MRNRRGRRLAGLGVGLALLLAGCGSDDGAGVRNVDGTQSPSGSGTGSGSGTASGQAAACKPVGDAATSDATIAVELKEWAVLPARADVPAGTVTFEARNTGEDAHELVVVRAADPASLPLAADGTVDEDKLPEGAFVGEIEAFPATRCSATSWRPRPTAPRRTTTPTACAPASRPAGSGPGGPGVPGWPRR